ncbi:hypothetical protein K1719_008123 [Acacia pycnantha]|nr:hypothetical protein K1719_008123 [Acacia pycnantha]
MWRDSQVESEVKLYVVQLSISLSISIGCPRVMAEKFRDGGKGKRIWRDVVVVGLHGQPVVHPTALVVDDEEMTGRLRPGNEDGYRVMMTCGGGGGGSANGGSFLLVGVLVAAESLGGEELAVAVVAEEKAVRGRRRAHEIVQGRLR